MNLPESTIAKINQLPESLVKEVNDFVDFLIMRWQQETKAAESQEIEPTKAEHPWLEFAGMYENNPLFAKVLEEMEIYRRQLDLEEKTDTEATESLEKHDSLIQEKVK
jgi:hypothetical protein